MATTTQTVETAPTNPATRNAVGSLKMLEKTMEKEQISRTDGYLLAPELVVPEPGFNTRAAFMDEEEYFALPEVAARVRAFADAYLRGAYVPDILVKVRNGVAYIRDGYTRRRGLDLAIREGAQIKKIHVKEFKGDEAEQSLAIINSNNGAPVSVLARAIVYARLQSWGWSLADIAAKSSCTPEAVRFALNLLELPMAIKLMIQKDEVAATYALEFYREHGENAASLLAEAIAEAKAMLAVEAAQNPEAAAAAASPTGKKRALVTKKNLTSKSNAAPKITKKVVTAMHTSLNSITARLDSLTTADNGETFVMTLSQADVALLRELAEKMPKIEDKAPESNENQQSLTLD